MLNTNKYACRIMVEDRNYSAWHFVDSETYNVVDTVNKPFFSHVDPAKHKLFSQDSIHIISSPENENEPSTVQLIHSTIRSHSFIAGVLLLENNKTFGRTTNKKRLLYKCLPNDKHLPAFLIPYEIKVGFNKSVPNKYVVFKFDNWNDKHPHGILVEVLGDVNNLNAFYEYQIYCKSLHVSMAEFNEKTKKTWNQGTPTIFMRQIVENTNFQIVCENTETIKSPLPPPPPIFTIDPEGCTDYDDAFQVWPPSAAEGRHNWKVKVYIANVFVWLETLELWNAFTQRVSTIYLPDRRRPMLPTLLADNLCSLRAGDGGEDSDKFVFSMTVEIDSGTGKIIDQTAIFQNEKIRVSRNYVYESVELLDLDDYSELRRISRRIDSKVRDSHDVVSFWMVQMNRICGEKMAQSRTGIFRAAFYLNKNLAEINENIGMHLADDTRRLIQNWNNTCGQYCVLNGTENDFADHEVMKLKNYIHITSPIRRLVDLLNQMIFMERFGMIERFSQEAILFLKFWVSQIEFINSSMRSIRKVQTDCEVLKKCTETPNILDNSHAGIIFDKMRKTDGTYSYMVYLEQIKLLSRVNSLEEWENYSSRDFKILIFEDEEQVKRKIRLFPVSE